MGRKPKYHTEEERRQARAQYDADYYSRNRRKILRRRKRSYAERTDASEDGPRRGAREPEIPEVSRSFKLISKQLNKFHAFIGPNLREYAETLCADTIETRSITALEDAMDYLHDLAETAQNACSRIRELTGASEEYTRAKDLVDEFTQALNVVDDLFAEASHDTTDLLVLRRCRENRMLQYFSL